MFTYPMERWVMVNSQPLTAVTSDDESLLLAHLQLALAPRVGPRHRQSLLDAFGSPREVLAASSSQLMSVPGIGPAIAQAVLESSARMAEDLLVTCRREAVQILLESDPGYPAWLRRIDDPPCVLFVRGAVQACDALAVAVVGARHATSYGMKTAEQLGGALAHAGYTVVSGLARGIDAAAHRGALAAGGRTLAVLGSGVLSVYPPEHRGLAAEIAAAGGVLSEPPPLTPPTAGAFPQRNRIISGLSLGTVVVQAAERSGAMITARMAGEQGREVFAVPGEISCRMSRGCHRLIQDGAKLVDSIDDILTELGPLSKVTVDPALEQASAARAAVAPRPAERLLTTEETCILEAIGTAATGSLIDQVIHDSGLAASQVLAAMSVLETRRLVTRLPGSRVARR